MLLVSSFFLSSCTQTDQIKSQVLNKVVEVKNADEKSENMSDDDLLKELSSDDSTLDADLKDLETELQ